MTAGHSSKYDLLVPRYTSYPTAPHFSAAIGENTYRQWLGDLDPQTPLSLYFHIPFCDSMCWFCGCYTKVVQQYKPIKEYLQRLHEEIALVAETLPGRFRAQHLHWGGGSPTLLAADDWHALLQHLRQHFEIAEGAELAVELDPRDTTEDYVRAIAAAGVNRASIGVQDFDPVVQQAINRDQPFDVVERVCNWLRAHGVDSINLDLMYGLPHQTVAGVEAMVELALRLEPARAALFGYAHVPWMKNHQKMIDEAALPDAEARWHQFIAASRHLTGAGYRAIGLDHFARPDDPLVAAFDDRRLHRNFQGYTTDSASVLLGFGASAIGSLPQGYAQNTAPLKDYATAVHAGRLPIARGIALKPEDRLRRDIIEQLMCFLAVDVTEVARRHQASPAIFDDAFAQLRPLALDGLIDIERYRVRVREEGRAFVRVAASAFDGYLMSGARRHSRAV